MKLTRSQKEERLQKVAGEMIQALLDWEESKPAPNLLEIEEEVLELRQRLGQAMVRVVVEGQAARQAVENPACSGCGGAMRYKGQKERAVESRAPWAPGGIEVDRGYYYCACGQSGFFPLDAQLELRENAWSEDVEREAVWLSAAVPSFALASEILQRMGQRPLSTTTLWRCTQAVAEAERERATALPVRGEAPHQGTVKAQRMGRPWIVPRFISVPKAGRI